MASTLKKQASPPITQRGADAEALRPLEFNLSYRLSFMSFLVTRAMAPVITAHDLTNQQWKVLSVLSHIAPATAQEVTQWVTLDKSAVSRTVRQLQEQGLINRKLHAQDARNVHLSLTAKGSVLYKRVAEELAALQAELMQDVSPAAGATLFRVLREVEDRLKERVQLSAPLAVNDEE